jgi:hypothetical protein
MDFPGIQGNIVTAKIIIRATKIKTGRCLFGGITQNESSTAIIAALTA